MGTGSLSLSGLAPGPPLDLVVVGGGINGAGIAREAARAGLRTVLLEADDFGFGTTWRSTRLIHGGLRYLEHGEFGLVRESLTERAVLLRDRPWLVRPQRFLLPTLPWSRRPPWQVRAGLAAYDLLAGRGSLPRHRRVDSEQAHALVPGLTSEAGDGFTFYDARAVAPERLAVELVLEAGAAGALFANHARVVAIDVAAGAVAGVVVEHRGTRNVVPCRNVVVAGGPWADQVTALAGVTEPSLDLTRGTHIVLDAPGHGLRSAVFSTARSDGRVFFVIPLGGTVLVGTTDERYRGDPGAVRPTRHEVDYLLAETRALFPGGLAEGERVSYAFAGLRPLARGRSGPEGGVSRRHLVLDASRRGGPQGLFSVVGGKLTTYRRLAGEVLDRLGVEAPPAVAPSFDRSAWRSQLARVPGDAAARARVSRYGPRLEGVLAMGREPLCGSCGLLAGEVRHAVATEAAESMGDVLAGRTGVAWGVERGLCCLDVSSQVAAEALGWTDEERREQASAYRELVRRHLPTPGEIGDGGER